MSFLKDWFIPKISRGKPFTPRLSEAKVIEIARSTLGPTPRGSESGFVVEQTPREKGGLWVVRTATKGSWMTVTIVDDRGEAVEVRRHGVR
jgi:hypothetical protein